MLKLRKFGCCASNVKLLIFTQYVFSKVALIMIFDNHCIIMSDMNKLELQLWQAIYLNSGVKGQYNRCQMNWKFKFMKIVYSLSSSIMNL
jgi:hypothetical protein